MTFRINRSILTWVSICSLTLVFCFASCTKGQDTDLGTEGNITTGGTEAEAEDVCEKPENLDNILCQWVATEMDPGYGKMTLQYNSQGRVILAEGYDLDGVKLSTTSLVYNDYGVWKISLHQDPNPPGSQNYQSEQRVDFEYYEGSGRVKSKKMERYSGGSKQSSMEWQYSDLQSNNTVSGVFGQKDGAGNLQQLGVTLITYDPGTGKIKSVDRRLSDGNTMNNPASWTQDSYHYDSQTGRLNLMISKTQNCAVTPCSFGGTFSPTDSYETEFFHDDQGRETGYEAKTTKGNKPDTTCEMTYEIETQAKIAGIHPLEFMINTFAPIPLNLGVNDRDIFSSWDCSLAGQPLQEIDFKWVRLWEALPEGQPPGGAD